MKHSLFLSQKFDFDIITDVHGLLQIKAHLPKVSLKKGEKRRNLLQADKPIPNTLPFRLPILD